MKKEKMPGSEPGDIKPKSESKEGGKETFVISGEQIADIIESNDFVNACHEAADIVRSRGHESGFSAFVSLENPAKIRVSEVARGETASVDIEGVSGATESQIYDNDKEVPIRVLDFHFHPEGEEHFAIAPSLATERSSEGDLRIDSHDRVFESYDPENKAAYLTFPIEVIGRAIGGGKTKFIAIQDKRVGRFADEMETIEHTLYWRTNEEDIIRDLGQAGFRAFFFSVDRDGKILPQDRGKFTRIDLPVNQRQLESEEEIEGAYVRIMASRASEGDEDAGFLKNEEDDEKEYIKPSQLTQEEKNHLYPLFKECYPGIGAITDFDLERSYEDVWQSQNQSQGLLSANSFEFPSDVRIFQHICGETRHEIFAFSQGEIESRIKAQGNMFREDFKDIIKSVKREMSAYEPQFRGKNIIASLEYHPKKQKGQEEPEFAVTFFVGEGGPIPKIKQIAQEVSSYLSDAGVPILDPDADAEIIYDFDYFRAFMNWMQNPARYQEELNSLLNNLDADAFFEDYSPYSFICSELIKLPGAKSGAIEKEIHDLREQIIALSRKNIFFRAMLAECYRRIGEIKPGAYSSETNNKDDKK